MASSDCHFVLIEDIVANCVAVEIAHVLPLQFESVTFNEKRHSVARSSSSEVCPKGFPLF